MSKDTVSATSGREWRKLREEGVLVELPSGFVARLRPVSTEWLYKSGKIPDALSSIVASIINTGNAKIESPQEMASAMVDMKMLMAKACFLDPKVVDNPTADDEIAYEDLSAEDSDFILSWAQRPQQDLASFRPKQDGDVESAHNSDNLQMPTE